MATPHEHRLVITLPRVRDWCEAERKAAALIRRYTNAPRESQDKVLRDAVFEASTEAGRSTWTVVVTVDV